ncbi:MAG: carbon-nitrogen hydrolase family protein [Saprospiraceae bacterium]
MTQNSLRLAIVQQKPVYLDLSASMQKALTILQEAAQAGANLVVFGETWFCGYPAWIDYLPNIALWGHEATEMVFAEMLDNALEVPSKDTQILCQMAADLKLYLVIGCNERVTVGAGQGTIYNSLLIISDQGDLVVQHRKLMPTYTEKLLYGSGDGHGLQTIDTAFGKLGGLICWEHWMPLTRQSMHLAGEHIHIALWPAVNDLHQLASRHYAFESQSFVVAVGQVLQVKDLPKQFELPEDLARTPDRYLLNGGSAVIGPDSNYLLEPQFDREELLIYEIQDLAAAKRGRLKLDVSGHYNRADVFDLQVNKKRL